MRKESVAIDEKRLRRIAAEFNFLLVTLPASAVATKEGIIRYLVNQLATGGKIPADLMGEVVLSLLRREQLGSTGIGRNLAIPHAVCAHLADPTGVFAYSEAGVPWDAVDGQPAYLICLALVPNNGRKLRWLETLARRLRD